MRRLALLERGEKRRTTQYLNVISRGPLIFVRVPLDPEPRWRSILKALTTVMRSHGLQQKDAHTIEGFDPEQEASFLDRLDAAYAGRLQTVPDFWLYDWKDGKFVLVREPIQKGTR